MSRNSFVTDIIVENPFYILDGFKVTIRRKDYRRGVVVENTYEEVSESSIRRLRITIPRIIKNEKKR